MAALATLGEKDFRRPQRSEFDDVLDRLAAEVSQRDARITDLEERLAARGVPRPDPIDPGA